MQQLCADRDYGGDDVQRHRVDGKYQLQLSGAGDGCSGESEPVLERGECDDPESGHATADGAEQSDGDGGERRARSI